MPHPNQMLVCTSSGTHVDGPTHDALNLTAGGVKASIVLHEQIYTLRITRQGKLILTK